MDSYAARLNNWRLGNLYRHWKIHHQSLLNFSSNDYLNLSQDPRLKQASIDAINAYGVGSTSSRAVYGTLPLHEEIEQQLAKFTKKESAILFNSGYQANSTLLKTIGHEKTLFLLDHNCHRSLVEGAYNSPAAIKRFRHNDPNHLADLLKKYRSGYSICWIVTESLFSMDGDFAPVKELVDLKNHYQSYLMVDDAHAIGVYGEKGSGLATEADLIVGVFGKAFGSFGAFAASSSLLIEYLRQFCPGLIYTTALPPPILGSIQKALEIIPGMDRERAHLHSLAPSHIIPIRVDDPSASVKRCEEEGIIVHAIRPPTVLKPIIRLSLTANHSAKDLEKVKRVLNHF